MFGGVGVIGTSFKVKRAICRKALRAPGIPLRRINILHTKKHDVKSLAALLTSCFFVWALLLRRRGSLFLHSASERLCRERAVYLVHKLQNKRTQSPRVGVSSYQLH